MAQRIRERDELVPAERFPVQFGVALLTNERPLVWRISGDRTLRASPAWPRPAAPASPTQSVLPAVIAWAGHRPGTLANHCQLAALLPRQCPRSQRCPSRRRRDR